MQALVKKYFVIYFGTNTGREPSSQVVDESYFTRGHGFHEPEQRDLQELPVDGIIKVSYAKIWRTE
jgi:hypothetical protein